MDKTIYEFIIAGIIFFVISIIILISVLFLAITTKKQAEARDVQKQKKIKELSDKLDEMQNLFKADIKHILDGFKSVLKNAEENF